MRANSFLCRFGFLMLAIMLCAGCAVKRPTYKSLNADKPLIPLKRKNVYLKPFSKNRMQQEWLYDLGSVEATFRDEFMKLFSRPNIFDDSSENGIEVTAELVYWEHADAVDSSMKTTVLYEFKLDDGTTLLSERISTEGQESKIWTVTGPLRQVRAAEKSLMLNLEQLYSIMETKLPEKYQAYLNNNKGHTFTASSRPVSRPVVVPEQGLDKNQASKLDFGTYYALIVGNNSYQFLPKLQSAVSDAQAISDLLKSKYKYRVKLLTNATRADILKSIAYYRKNLNQNDNLLIYYAGHGWLDKEADEGYWLPVDAEKDVQTNWISNGFITNSLKAISANHVLVIADSCYSGKLARGLSIVLRNKNYYQRIASRRSRTVLASGGLEPVMDKGGKGNHSVFASALMDTLSRNKGILDATAVFDKIRRPVVLNSDQSPEYSDIRKAGHDGGDFIFIAR